MTAVVEGAALQQPSRLRIPHQPTGLAERGPLFIAPQVRWLPRYARLLVLIDALALLLAAGAAVLAEALHPDRPAQRLPQLLIAGVVVGLWWAALALGRVYESRFLGEGAEEFRRVANASLRLGALVTFLAYALQLAVPRSFVAVLLPRGMALLLLSRFGARRVVVAGRPAPKFPTSPASPPARRCRRPGRSPAPCSCRRSAPTRR